MTLPKARPAAMESLIFPPNVVLAGLAANLCSAHRAVRANPALVCSAKSRCLALPLAETSIRFRRFRDMPARRRPPRLTVATTVFLAVIATLVVIVARGPTKYFQSRNVQSGVSCTLRHCQPTDDEPDGSIWRYTRK